MEKNEDTREAERSVITVRTMEIIVALLLLVIGAVVAIDSFRLGARWSDEGPQSGYFPFYIGLIICISSLGTLLHTVLGKAGDGSRGFVERGQLRQVLAVLLPAAFYILGIQLVGMYVASAVYIAVFMIWLGSYSWFKSVMLGVAVSVSLFVMFEVWFKVPLPKGMFNSLGFLGY
jgi:hypothetical protein